MSHDSQSEERLVYTPQQLCQVLGIGSSSVYEGLRESRIPCIRIGRKIRIPKRVVEQMLDVDSPAVSGHSLSDQPPNAIHEMSSDELAAPPSRSGQRPKLQ